jgi:hypothetical protein
VKTISFDEIHARVAAPQPIDARIALTPRGDACVAARRFLMVLRDLDATDRAEVLAMFGHQLRSVIASLATGT